MPSPIAPIEIDLARDPVTPPIPPRFTRARVLVRWSGEPIAIVELSVRAGRITAADALHAVQAQDPHALPRAAVRRALTRTGVPEQPNLAAIAAADTTPSTVPSISVALCTRDRTEDLAVCLAAIARLDPAPLEVLVIDNAPATDATRRLVQTHYPQFRYARENQPGLDHARNHALRLARGEIIAFTDDDAVPDPGWIGALARTFAADRTIGLVTGLAEPVELETHAQILFERYGGFGRGCRRLYSQTRAGGMPWTLVGAGQLGAGVNLAFRREVIAHVGGFDPALDVGTATLGGGDHEFFYRVLRAGWLCVYEPAALVRHRHRRTMAELRRLLYSYGHGTRCFLERESAAFPADRSAIRRLRRWWWRNWAFARLGRALVRPPLLPAELVWTEIKGFIRGRGVYARTRHRLGSVNVDQPTLTGTPPVAGVSRGGRIGIAVIETSRPVEAVPGAAEFDAMELVVQWHGRPVGNVRVASLGQPLSARRVADEIAHALWHRLLEPAHADISAAFVRFGSTFAAQLRAPLPAAAPTATHATVLVATCGRPAALRRCLESLHRLRTRHELEILVVDNRPGSDATAAVVQDFPGVRLIAEPRRGSSYARNTGLAAARGEFVAMIDDDMVADPDWLDRLLAPFARADVTAVTGLTLPAQLGTRAEQLLEEYGGFSRGFIARDFDSAWFHRWRRRAVPTWQIGGTGNAAFRRAAFRGRRAAPFAVTLGAGVPAGVGEDTKLFYDLLHAGATIAYEPAAVAWHHHRISLPELRAQLRGYSRGHVAYHLLTWFEYRDSRALVRLAAELPLAFLQRALARLRGHTAYPWSLLLTEFLGTLAGPWALWQSHRQARRLARAARVRPPAARTAPPLRPTPQPATEGRL